MIAIFSVFHGDPRQKLDSRFQKIEMVILINDFILYKEHQNNLK